MRRATLALPRALRPAPMLAITPQKRFSSLYELPGKRDQEAFLSQYDPLEVLGCPSNASLDQIKERHAEMVEFYSKGSKASKSKLERCNKAMEVILDPTSPYYVKSRMQDVDRRRLMLEVLPAKHRYIVMAQAYTQIVIAAMGGFLVLYILFLPVKKMIRAANRS